MELISKKQAAAALNVSTRAIERAVRCGRLRVQYRDSKHGKKAWFTATALNRYKQHKDAQTALGFTSAIGQPANGLTIGTVMPVVDLKGWSGEGRDKRRRRRTNSVPIAERLTLSVDEAVQLAGLPRNFVIANLQSGRLKAIKIGRRWYTKRSELDAFVESL